MRQRWRFFGRQPPRLAWPEFPYLDRLSDEDLIGRIEFRHHGPLAFLSVRI